MLGRDALAVLQPGWTGAIGARLVAVAGWLCILWLPSPHSLPWLGDWPLPPQAQAKPAPQKLHGFTLVEEQYVAEYDSQVGRGGHLRYPRWRVQADCVVVPET